MNKSKVKGTRLETAFSTWWSQNVGPCGRLALHGRDDNGDVGGLEVRGLTGVVECKNYKFTQKKKENRRPTPKQLEKWLDETEKERINSCSDFALLVIHKSGCTDRAVGTFVAESFKDNWCWLSVRSYRLLSGSDPMRIDDGSWIQMTVGEVADMCK